MCKVYVAKKYLKHKAYVWPTYLPVQKEASQYGEKHKAYDRPC